MWSTCYTEILLVQCNAWRLWVITSTLSWLVGRWSVGREGDKARQGTPLRQSVVNLETITEPQWIRRQRMPGVKIGCNSGCLPSLVGICSWPMLLGIILESLILPALQVMNRQFRLKQANTGQRQKTVLAPQVRERHSEEGWTPKIARWLLESVSVKSLKLILSLCHFWASYMYFLRLSSITKNMPSIMIENP